MADGRWQQVAVSGPRPATGDSAPRTLLAAVPPELPARQLAEAQWALVGEPGTGVALDILVERRSESAEQAPEPLVRGADAGVVRFRLDRPTRADRRRREGDEEDRLSSPWLFATGPEPSCPLSGAVARAWTCPARS